MCDIKTEQDYINDLDYYKDMEDKDPLGAIPFDDVVIIGSILIDKFGWTKEMLLKRWYSIFWMWYEQF